MIFTETPLKGAFIIDIERLGDERGFFARTWCEREFHAHGLNPCVVQCNVSFNRKQGTWRGMHYQETPHEEAKLVRCTSGSIYDIIIDLRRESPTFKEHIGVVLSAENRKMLYVPERFAHGFITLTDDTEIFYQMSEFYCAQSARGIRWDDPSFGLSLPHEVTVISERDRSYPDFTLQV